VICKGVFSTLHHEIACLTLCSANFKGIEHSGSDVLKRKGGRRCPSVCTMFGMVENSVLKGKGGIAQEAMAERAILMFENSVLHKEFRMR